MIIDANASEYANAPSSATTDDNAPDLPFDNFGRALTHVIRLAIEGRTSLGFAHGRCYHVDVWTTSSTVSGFETHVRSVAKGASYRLFGTLTTMAIGFLMTGSARTALALGSAEVTTKLLLFWGHERVWDRIVWGRRSEPAKPWTPRTGAPGAARTGERPCSSTDPAVDFDT